MSDHATDVEILHYLGIGKDRSTAYPAVEILHLRIGNWKRPFNGKMESAVHRPTFQRPFYFLAYSFSSDVEREVTAYSCLIPHRHSSFKANDDNSHQG